MRNSEFGMRKQGCVRGNERGVALLIVLLVTALLVALVFEFAYGTRVSLRAAVNFRDSERAYFLARSGMNVFLKYPQLKENTPQGEWTVVPMVSSGDTELRMRWEDERGKLNINAIDLKPGADWVDLLFVNQGVGTDVFDKVKDLRKERRFNLLSELHAGMGDEDYVKVAQSLSVYSDNVINFNTASVQVMRSLGCSENAAQTIVELRSREPFQDIEKVKPYLPATLTVSNQNLSSSIFILYSYATVGDYTKQVEAVVNGGIVQYWRSL